MIYDIVLYGGSVLTVNESCEAHENGVVGVADNRIQMVGATTPGEELPRARRYIDACGGIMMPGLVNTHTHAAMALFRGLADDLPLMSWLADHMFKAEARWVTPESVYAAARLAFAEILLSGTTTCCDGYFFEDAVARAAQEAGIRAVLAQGILDFPAPGVPDPSKNVSTAMDFIGKWQNKSPRIIPGMFCHSPYTCGERTLRRARDAADEAGCLLQIHVAETRGEVEKIKEKTGRSPFAYLESIGLLNHKTLAVHAVWASEEDVRLIRDNGVGVSVTTESEMKLASGVAPLPGFLRAGLVVGLGTDGCASNNNQDMFQEMDFVAMLHKVNQLDPTVLDARTVLHLATRGGAAAVGLENEIGSIEVRKRADIITIDTAKPHWTPVYDPNSHLVYVAKGSDVKDVVIDGHVVVENRVVQTMNMGQVIEEVEKWARQIASSD